MWTFPLAVRNGSYTEALGIVTVIDRQICGFLGLDVGSNLCHEQRLRVQLQ
jgi:hypothetical protein